MYGINTISRNRRRLITVEIIVEDKKYKTRNTRIPSNKKLLIYVDYKEKQIQKIVKAAGGRW